jgi:hypothetical protein
MAVDTGAVAMELTLVGVGAMNSPRYRPAGLLVRCGRCRVMLDGGRESTPRPPLDAWLVCDERAELMPDIRRRCRTLGGLKPVVAEFAAAACGSCRSAWSTRRIPRSAI